MNYSLTIKIILILLFIYLLIIFYVYTKQRSLLYVPQIDNYDDELLIIPAEQVFIENSSNIKLRSIFYKHPSNTKTTLLMFHGNAGPIENRFYKINKLSKYDQNILLISWRSYSGNDGEPTEDGLYDDARSAIKWLEEKNISKKDIIIYGESLGTAVSIEIAQNNNFKGLILEAPFTSMIDAAKFHYPYLPVSIMLKDKYLSDKKIKEKMYKLANSPKSSYFVDENEHLVTYDENLMNKMDEFYETIINDE